ncbi:MAG: hypothetical protein U0522_03025 [Candidatus Paceibacterota bacterium]
MLINLRSESESHTSAALVTVNDKEEFNRLDAWELRKWITVNIGEAFCGARPDDLVVVYGGPREEIYDFKMIVWNGVVVGKYGGGEKLIELSELKFHSSAVYTKSLGLVRKDGPFYGQTYARRDPERWQ